MSVERTIVDKLQVRFSPTHLDVVNESGQHNVAPGSETHFKVTLVANSFEGQRLVARHQSIYKALQLELESGVHALALHCYTPAEWQSRQAAAPASPSCRGGSASERPPTLT